MAMVSKSWTNKITVTGNARHFTGKVFIRVYENGQDAGIELEIDEFHRLMQDAGLMPKSKEQANNGVEKK